MFGKITKEVKETDVSMEKEGPPIHTLLSWLKKKIPNKQRKEFQEARMKQEMVMMKRQQQGQGQCQSNGSTDLYSCLDQHHGHKTNKD
uniref:Uncharacterized protein n=1 Tax=Brassica oleracea var. oleracea TaxID=109376 RepID=A0A0D3AJ10_BRAOL